MIGRRLWRSGLAAAVLVSALTATPLQASALPGCHFILGFATLQSLDPAAIGNCIDNQTFGVNGDAVQHTTRGLLAWRKADNWTAFTNGYQTWINGPSGLVQRYNDEWFEWEAYPAETNGVPVDEAPPAPRGPNEISLGPLIHVDQTLNNCGPAAIAEVLRYYGITQSQEALQGLLRPDDPAGMPASVVAPYVRGIGLRALVGTHGSDRLMKILIRAGFPAIVEQLVGSSDTELHYRPLEGYDDQRALFLAADTLLGPRHAIGYAEFDRIWTVTQNLFVVVYPPARQQALDSALAAAGWR